MEEAIDIHQIIVNGGKPVFNAAIMQEAIDIHRIVTKASKSETVDSAVTKMLIAPTIQETNSPRLLR